MADDYRRDPATAGRLAVGGSLPGTIDRVINDPFDAGGFYAPGIIGAARGWSGLGGVFFTYFSIRLGQPLTPG